jgi:hypothetical protein
MPKNPLDAILAEVLGDDGGLLLVGNWPADEDPAEAPRHPPEAGPDEAERPTLLLDV